MTENPAEAGTSRRPFARVTLEVEVHLDHLPGVNNPIQGYEPGYDYFAVREAEVTNTEIFGDRRHLALLREDLDDLDPDSLLSSVVREALDMLTPPEGNVTKVEEYQQLINTETHEDTSA